MHMYSGHGLLRNIIHSCVTTIVGELNYTSVCEVFSMNVSSVVLWLLGEYLGIVVEVYSHDQPLWRDMVESH